MASSPGGAAERHYVCRTLVLLEGSGWQPGPHAWGSQQDHCSRLRLEPGSSPPEPLLRLRGQWETHGLFKQLPSSRSFPHRLPARGTAPKLSASAATAALLGTVSGPRAHGEAGRGGRPLGLAKSWMMWRFCANPSSPQMVPFQRRETPWSTRGLGTH